jgi:hypothetical protein
MCTFVIYFYHRFSGDNLAVKLSGMTDAVKVFVFFEVGTTHQNVNCKEYVILFIHKG